MYVVMFLLTISQCNGDVLGSTSRSPTWPSTSRRQWGTGTPSTMRTAARQEHPPHPPHLSLLLILLFSFFITIISLISGTKQPESNAGPTAEAPNPGHGRPVRGYPPSSHAGGQHCEEWAIEGGGGGVGRVLGDEYASIVNYITNSLNCSQSES